MIAPPATSTNYPSQVEQQSRKSSIFVRTVLQMFNMLPIMLIILAIALPANALPAISTIEARTVQCQPASWADLIIFFIGNYVAHTVTLKPFSGESASRGSFYGFLALLFPFTGIWRGFQGIASAVIFAENTLQVALRARALCVVGRSEEWRPLAEETVSGCIIQDGQSPKTSVVRAKHMVQDRAKWWQRYYIPIAPSTNQIHGQYFLPTGYQIYKLRPGVKVQAKYTDLIDLASSRNFVKITASIAQLLFACATLYRARGTQLDRYGYAAFGLTVLSYAIMSFLNLLADFITPEFTHLYIVHSEVLREAEARAGVLIALWENCVSLRRNIILPVSQ